MSLTPSAFNTSVSNKQAGSSVHIGRSYIKRFNIMGYVLGYSLIELIITMAIAATFITLGTASFNKLFSNNHITLSNNQLIQSLHLARSYAISRQQYVNLCALADNAQTPNNTKECNNDFNFNSNWSNGWLIFIDSNFDKLFNSGDTLLKIIELNQTPNVNISFNQRGRLRFSPNGSARSASFYLCIPKQQIYRRLALLHTGRTRSTEQLSNKQKQACGKI